MTNSRRSPTAMGRRRIGNVFVKGVGQTSMSMQPSRSGRAWPATSRQWPSPSASSSRDREPASVVTQSRAVWSRHPASQAR